MAPRTRSRVQDLEGRIYHSSPALQQVEFPARRHIVKTYGKRPPSARSLRQQTLTQIDYVTQSASKEDPEMSPTKKEPPGKRRKTMGDTPNSSFHTQTLTQLLSEKGENDAGDDPMLIKDSDADTDDEQDMIDLPMLPPWSAPKRKASESDGKSKANAPSPVPETPSHKKIKVNLDEVPSSQPTPFTPMLDRYDQIPERSPLKEKSTNVDAAPITIESMSKRPRNMVIQDSYSPGSRLSSSIAAQSSPPQKATPTNQPKRQPLGEIPVPSLELSEDVSVLLGENQTPTQNRAGSGRKRAFVEIPDSDDELDAFSPSPLKNSSVRRTPQCPLITGLFGSIVRSGGSTATSGPGIFNDESNGILANDDTGITTPTVKEAVAVVTSNNTAAISAEPAEEREDDEEEENEEEEEKGDEEVEPEEEREVDEEEAEALPNTTNSEVVEPSSLTSAPVQDHEMTEQESTEVTSSEAGDPPTPTPAARRVHIELSSSSVRQTADLGTPTRAVRRVHIELPVSSALEDIEPKTPTPVGRRVQIELPRSSIGEVLEETPRPLRRKSPLTAQRHTQARSQRHTQARSQRQTQAKSQGRSQAKSQFYSQGLESQRVPLDVIRSLGPQTDRTDILISIHPEPTEAIVDGTKDHEFRNYKFPPNVLRCWIYVTKPVGEVRYMVVLGPAKEPGEIDSDSGVGNAEFNDGTSGYKFAHHLVQVYELNNPVPLADMKDNGLGDGPPNRHRYIPPAIVGQLMANLRCSLFTDGDEELEEGLDDGEEDEDVTISQELAEQIRSDILSSTQMVPPSSSQRGRHHDDVIPASPEIIPASHPTTTPTAPAKTSAVRSSTRIRSRQTQKQQQQLQKSPSSIRRRHAANYIRPSQATTASEPSSPSQDFMEDDDDVGTSLSIPRPLPDSSGPSLRSLIDTFDDEIEQGSPIRLPLGIVEGSSQSAAMMQDSLLVDDVRRPPEIWDSDEGDFTE
ncbi:hypothetical protein B0H63DRAFT_462387 [Podospora didyma]|uniref:Uncharacterized protein n=1 Tax=Podospora didyma TaxID=330526 RepID=A0AAE0P8D7_9PEZI|nr:hypothetical protein B0H63DRAFT_462387 [Podospora didyma]